ncbi:MAG: DASS family sodium-coupled anion symporter [Acidobacteriota bacterium]|jgi:sodium-dependent dicarboxylate transporter 2/3/5
MPATPTSQDSSLRPRVGLVAGSGLFVLMLLSPAPAGLGTAGWHTAAVGVLMAVWWMSEALPIAVTALLPIVLFPVLGVAPVGDATSPYANPLIFLFLGGFVIALGMQRWHLHRRIALVIIRGVGTRPRRIIAGFMIASAFLSMWISNTATTMMMLPIGLSVIEIVTPEGESATEALARGRTFALALMLAIAYAASIGGVGTIIGSPPNALMVGFMDQTYGVEVSFLQWMGAGTPLAALGLALSYLVLVHFVFPVRLDDVPGGGDFIRDELRRMGPMSGPEKGVAVIFGLTATLWVTRPLVERILPGISDTGIALFGATLLFLVPVDWRRGEFLLDWARARKLPWGMLLLFGGGLSLASAVRATGLAGWIGGRLQGLEALPVLLIALTVTATVILLTELTSNTATTATFLPIVASVAVGLGENPLLFLVPATLAASCAFMMPVATPPNAIVYGSGYVTIPQMVRAGIWLNVLFLALIGVLAYTLLPWVMGVELGTVPAWAQSSP